MPSLTLLELEPDVRLELPREGHSGGGGARMRMTNVSDQLVAFKLKSTAPKNYAIKPSTATIRKGEALEVQILRRPPEEAEGGGGDDEPEKPSKSKRPDRFLVQAAVVDTEEKKTLLTGSSKGKGLGVAKFWDGVTKEALEERQLEVVLVDSAGNGSSAAHEASSRPVKEPKEKKEPKEPKEPKERKERKEPKEPKEPVPEPGNGHGAASGSRDPSDGKGKSVGKDYVDAKGDAKGAGKDAGKDAGNGKKGDDGKGKRVDGPAMTDADIDAVIGMVSKPGRSVPHERPPPPGFGPPPGPGMPGYAGPPGFAAPPAAGEVPVVVLQAPGRQTTEEAAQAVPAAASRPNTLKSRTQRKHEDVVLAKHQRPVTFVTFNPNGKELYTCGKDKLVFAFSAEGEFIRQYEGHRGAVWACSVTYDGVLLLTCGADSMVLLWDVASAQKLTEVQLTGVARFVDWVPHGDRSLPGQRHFAACSNNFKDRPAALTVWDSHDTASEPQQLLMIKELPSPSTQVVWCGAGCDILCSVHTSAEGEVLFWHGNNGSLIGRLEAHSGPTSQVAFASDRSLMASCGRVDMCVKLWDLSTGLSSGEATLVQNFPGDRPLNAVALRGALVRADVSAATAGQSSGICDCLVGGGQDAREVALVGAGTDDQFDPVPMKCGREDTFELYVAPGAEGKQGGHFGPIHALCFSLDGSHCVSGSEDGNVRIRDLRFAPGTDTSVQAASPPAVLSPAPTAPQRQPKAQAKQPQPQPKTQPKAQAKQASKVELATQIPSQAKAPAAKAPQPLLSEGLASRVIAVYDFDPLTTGWPFGNAQRPLPFSRGQEIEVVQDFGGGWAWGKSAGNQGLFPMNFVLPMAKYQEIMQRSLPMAKAGSPTPSPTIKPVASPPLKPQHHDASGLSQLDARSGPSGGFGLGGGLGALGGFGAGATSAGFGPSGMPPGFGGGPPARDPGGASSGGLFNATGAPPGFGGGAASPPGFVSGPVGGITGGVTRGLIGEAAAPPVEEEEGDCSQS